MISEELKNHLADDNMMEKSIRQKIEGLAKSFEDVAIKFRLANQAMMDFADMYRKQLPSLNEFNKNPVIVSSKVYNRLNK